jgi:hypothetical protein
VSTLNRRLEEEQEVTEAARSQLYDYKQMVTMVGGWGPGAGGMELACQLSWQGGLPAPCVPDLLRMAHAWLQSKHCLKVVQQPWMPHMLPQSLLCLILSLTAPAQLPAVARSVTSWQEQASCWGHRHQPRWQPHGCLSGVLPEPVPWSDEPRPQPVWRGEGR